MPPAIATLVFLGLVLVLIVMDRDRESPTSAALWIPIAWVFIGASRMPSEWMGAGGPMDSPDQYLEGSPFDALIVALLLAAGLMVLSTRGRQLGPILKKNWPIVLFFLYCLASTTWSDFPLVAFKRWTKSLGNVAMVFIVLSDPHPTAAMKRLLAVAGFLLLPTSVLLIKYYPALGRGYDRWVGTAYYNGVTPAKNLLGCDCLVFGMAAFSRVISGLWMGKRSIRTRAFVAQAVLMATVVWLFVLVNSATSLACFIFGATVILLLTRSQSGRPLTIHFLIGTMAIAGLIAFIVFDGKASLLQALGRDATLTGRTELWDDLAGMNRHPFLGTGFESFFLGDRARILWNKYWWHPTEAHNGYLETLINLGYVGGAFLLLVVVTGYRNAVSTYRTDSTLGALKLAVLLVALVYNMTEAAFKVMNPMWIAFILAVAAAPEAAEPVQAVSVPELRPAPVQTRFQMRPRPVVARSPQSTTFTAERKRSVSRER